MAGTPGPLGLSFEAPIIDTGTQCRSESPRPGPLGAQPKALEQDELTPIAQYMADEMNRNAHGKHAKHMGELNRFSAEACIADYTKLPLWQQLLGLGIDPQKCQDMELSYQGAALMIWAGLVRQDGDWDHKPKISARFHPRAATAQHWHLYGKTLYFYDVWSNMHYGYVGLASGFSEAQLLDGAGLEQIGSDLLRFNAPQRSPLVDGLRAFDAPSDRAAIQMGMALYRTHPSAITAAMLVRTVTRSTAITTKPYQP
jgi:hypothetical protein